MQEKTVVEKIIAAVGSTTSLIIHTLLFIGSFLLSIFGFVPFDSMLLSLTTIVSLEAIYLAIFIQMSVNRQSLELAEVSEDVEEIQEDIEDIQEDVEEIQEDVEEITEEEAQEDRQEISIEQLTHDVRRLLEDLEQLKRK